MKSRQRKRDERKEPKERRVKRNSTTTTTPLAPEYLAEFEKVPHWMRQKVIDAIGVKARDVFATGMGYKMPPSLIREWIEVHIIGEFAFDNGEPMVWNNYWKSLRMWGIMEPTVRANNLAVARRLAKLEERKAEQKLQRVKDEKLAKVIAEAKVNPALWALCRERCAFAPPEGECECRSTLKIAGCPVPAFPPDRHPVSYEQKPSEECPHYQKGGEA